MPQQTMWPIPWPVLLLYIIVLMSSGALGEHERVAAAIAGSLASSHCSIVTWHQIAAAAQSPLVHLKKASSTMMCAELQCVLSLLFSNTVSSGMRILLLVMHAAHIHSLWVTVAKHGAWL